MDYIADKWEKNATGQCHNCKLQTGCNTVAETWYSNNKVTRVPNAITNAEVICISRERCATFDDAANLTQFDIDGHSWVIPIEWIDDSASCEFWEGR